MRDRVLTYAIAISVLLHVAAVGVIGRTSVARLNNAAPQAHASRLINVDLVNSPDDALKPPPKPVVPEAKPEPEVMPDRTRPMPPTANVRPQPSPVPPRPVTSYQGAQPNGTGTHAPGNPGGKLNIGSTSAHGDLSGNWSGGRTPSGWVPGNDNSQGKGSGNSAGVGTPEPVKNATEGPSMHASPPPPTPKTVSVRICEDSGMLAGEHCKRTRTESFIEGNQPTRICDRCKAPHISRLADQAKPVLIKDCALATGSLDEGLSVSVSVEYTVTADGDVTGVSITRSSGNRATDQAAVRATSRLKYKPAVQDGVPRSVKMTRTYQINT